MEAKSGRHRLGMGLDQFRGGGTDQTRVSIKPKDSLLIRKFVRRMNGSKRKIVNGQIFEKAANPEA